MSDVQERTERRRFLKGAGAAAGAIAAANIFGGETSVQAQEINAMQPTPEQIQGFLGLKHEGPIVMVNLLKFKPDGGREEYAKYAAAIQPILEKLGARILFSGQAKYCLIGAGDWDAVALVEYPKKEALYQMSMSPEYRAIHHHREAGLAGQVNYAVAQNPAP